MKKNFAEMHRGVFRKIHATLVGSGTRGSKESLKRAKRNECNDKHHAETRITKRRGIGTRKEHNAIITTIIENLQEKGSGGNPKQRMGERREPPNGRGSNAKRVTRRKRSWSASAKAWEKKPRGEDVTILARQGKQIVSKTRRISPCLVLGQPQSKKKGANSLQRN